MSDEIPIYVLAIGEPVSEEKFEEFSSAIRDSIEDLDGRVVLVNREVEALTKGDLREIIDD